jgi:cellulose synthase/poly-beta-1,6-N-acetylglucosamine synthase-like glycosyltransferase
MTYLQRVRHTATKATVAAGLAAAAMAHLGYPVLVRSAAQWRRRSAVLILDPVLPTMTVVIPAHDEEPFIEAKLLNTLSNGYPEHLLEVVVVDDGSADRTAEIAHGFAPRVKLLRLPHRGGKSQAMNAAVSASTSEVVVFTDANGSLAPGSLAAVVRPFVDPEVGMVAGTKVPLGAGAHGGGESMYWRLETALRDAEGVLGAVVGADGGVYAVRRSAFRAIPPHVLADDYWIPLDILRRRLKVAHVSSARAFEAVAETRRDEFHRRTRAAAGVCDVTLRNLDLTHPDRGWVGIAFICHRVLRNVVVPVSLPLTLVASLLGSRENVVLRVIAGAQVVAWTACAAGAFSNAKAFSVPYQFGMANAAALRGAVDCTTRRRHTPLWEKRARGEWHSPSPAASELEKAPVTPSPRKEMTPSISAPTATNKRATT